MTRPAATPPFISRWLFTLLLPVFTVFALFGAGMSVAGGRETLPHTEAGDRLREFLDTFGRADTAGIRNFVEREYADDYKAAVPIEARIQLFLDARARGRLEATELLATDSDTIRVRARHALTREWRTIELTVDPGRTARIKRISVSFDWPHTVDEFLAASSKSALEPAVTRYVGMLERQRLFSGAIRLDHAGKAAIDQAWGFADLNFRVGNTRTTRFNLGSASKMWTVAAIMRLISEGALTLDTPLSKFDLGVPLPGNAADITVAHLLSHTSGLGNYFGPKYDATPKASLDDIDDFLALDTPLQTAFKPGSEYSYSNTGYVVLGKIIEAVSGQSYHDYIASVVFAPAGMSESGCYAIDDVVPNLAAGYDRTQTDSGPVFSSNILYLPRRSVSAGGCYATTGDMMRFLGFLKSGTIASADTLSTFTSRQAPGVENYGFGFQLGTNGEWYGHGGYFNGVGAVIRQYRKPAGWSFAVLANQRDTAENVAEFLNAAIARQP